MAAAKVAGVRVAVAPVGEKEVVARAAVLMEAMARAVARAVARVVVWAVAKAVD